MGISDNGPGVSGTERDLVTQRFYRGRRDVEGAGLGLSLVMAIANLHGLTVGFAAQGSMVTLSRREG